MEPLPDHTFTRIADRQMFLGGTHLHFQLNKKMYGAIAAAVGGEGAAHVVWGWGPMGNIILSMFFR